MQDINLLPQSEIVEQSKVKAVKVSTIFSAIFLVLVLGVAGYVLYLDNKTKSEIASLDSQIQSFRNEIVSRSAIEITVRNLDKKQRALKTIFDDQKKYSMLMEELRIRKPAEVVLESADVVDGKININGTANNYIEIANFVNNLLSTEFTGGAQTLGKLFTSVSLNSVSMESTKNEIQFFLVVDFDSGILR